MAKETQQATQAVTATHTAQAVQQSAVQATEDKSESRIANQEARQGLSRSGKLKALARIVGILEEFQPTDQEWIIARLAEVTKES